MKYRQIKEVAKQLQTTTRTIRFYEEKGLISPIKNQDNQYRLYSEKDAWRLQTIISLRETGMSITGIQKVLEGIDEGSEQEVLYYLELQRSLMYSQWVELKQIIESMDHLIDLSKQNQTLVWEDVFQLAEGIKRVKDMREDWTDRWNFDRQASTYDEQVKQEREFNVHENYEEALDLTNAWIEALPGERGLGIGTGTGNLAARFMLQGVEMAGIDQSREMLKRCQEKHPRMETKLGNFLAIPYVAAEFDFIVTSYALHHLTDEQKLLALAEMDRVLKSSGRICITDLMFENQIVKESFFLKCKENGREDIIAEIEDEFYADRSLLVEWLEKHHYQVRTKQINNILHIVFATK